MIAILRRLRHHPAVKDLGPGLITGAADDDPSGIATYSQAGAQFGFNMLWTAVVTYPLMVGIQMVSARLGCISGHGLAANIKQHLPRWVLYVIVGLLLVANTINIAADIAAMGQAMRLLVDGSVHLYSVAFGLLSVILQVFLRYQTYVQYLKWLTLSLLAYVAVAFTIHMPWLNVLSSLVLPQVALDSATLTLIVALFGTTISPYLFFWQAAQEVEDLRSQAGLNAFPHGMEDARRHLRRIKRDTYIGMGFSNLVAFFIILSTAATLHASGVTHIETAAQAAEALRPVAGDFTFVLFSLGIIGTGMLAVPVLAGSAAYAVAETLNWRTGLDLRLEDGKEFYTIIAVATLGGVALNFTSVNAIEALFWSAVINGVIAVPIMAVMMRLGTNPSVLGDFVIRARLRRLGWFATALMAIAVLAMLYTLAF
jgi:NRAMP (natural resistance-associated macrophage protein)-like metal ion transporter